ncbi:glutamate-5-semialdehyde dehydrogenase [Clostridium massiliodielmoense]|uniref:glutamate-5-semialdehyde dehydrogenase n=1 Tax=Clostridium massiliodielmoense TaxID=1776385 RepID=UPI000A26C7D9|nr:glutamate-5-semialdehyde dehydrogenase [Clostridium massiliodielmoense]
MNIENYVIETASLAKSAARKMAIMSTVTKNNALNAMADALIENTEAIIEANKKDMDNGREKGLTESLLDRLLLDEERIKSMAQGLRDVSSLDDPIGEVIRMWRRPNNLKIGQIRVPLGVIGIIYEARPNVTVDAAAICIKSSNTAILRGGSEAIHSNSTIAKIISDAAVKAGLPEGAINFIETPSRDAVNIMMKLNGYIDVLIPRGGAGLINAVVKNATVPVIETGTGNCHVYVDASADLEIAANIVINAKTQRPSVCNAMESLLVHKDIADKFLPYLAEKLKPLNVEIKGCKRTQSLVESATEATEEDFAKEFLDFKFASKVVDSLDEALDHIYKYSTKHSEVIVTNNYENSQRFLNEVDAAAVYVNASSRFTDGSEFGFGAEIGISTQKLHARGPMGLKELTSSKYIIYGEGQTR